MQLVLEDRTTSVHSRPKTDSIKEEKFVRFGESPLWTMQREYFEEKGIDAWREREVPHYVTSHVLMVEAYVDIVFNYWCDGLSGGTIDPKQPLYLLELGAGCGRFAYLFLEKMCATLARYGGCDLSFCYLISDVSENTREFLTNHPYLQPYLNSGKAAIIPFDAEVDSAIHLPDRDIPLRKLQNPLVVVANYVFDGLIQDMFSIHYGSVGEGWVNLVPVSPGEDAKDLTDQPIKNRGSFGNWTLDYEWRNSVQIETHEWEGLLALYQKRLDSIPVLMPAGALHCLDRLEVLSNGEMLLLSADKGYFQESELRKQAPPQLSCHGSFSLPVNFHAITAHLESKGAWVFNQKYREEGLVYHAALFSESRETYGATMGTIVQRYEGFSPDDFFTIKQHLNTAADQLTSIQMMAYLRLSGYDARVLALFLPQLLTLQINFSPRELNDWRKALEQTWQHYFPLGEGDDFCFQVGLLAYDLEHWGLAKAIFQMCLYFYGEQAPIWHNYGLCEFESGNWEEAHSAFERALVCQPDDEKVQAIKQQVENLQEHHNQLNWFFPELAQDEELRLHPLGRHHARAFFYQYRDPQIGIMTHLPELNDLESVETFIQSQEKDPKRAIYAVLHQHWGFIGVVSMSYARDAGYFYYWIGTDYQNNRFGQRAARLLFQQAKALGLTKLFTSVYEFNARSQHGLEKTGFERMDCRAREPDDRELFYRRHLSSNCQQEDDLSQFLQLLEDTESPIRLITS